MSFVLGSPVGLVPLPSRPSGSLAATSLPRRLRYRMIEAEGAYPMQRLGCEATSSYLQRPHTSLIQHFKLLQQYWQAVTMFNRTVDSIDTPLSAGDYTKQRAEGAYHIRDQINNIAAQLVPVVSSTLAELGPLVAP